MHPAKKVLAFVVSSLLIVVVGLAVLNRIAARSAGVRRILGGAA